MDSEVKTDDKFCINISYKHEEEEKFYVNFGILILFIYFIIVYQICWCSSTYVWRELWEKDAKEKSKIW